MADLNPDNIKNKRRACIVTYTECELVSTFVTPDPIKSKLNRDFQLLERRLVANGLVTSQEQWQNKHVNFGEFELLIFLGVYDYIIFPEKFKIWLEQMKQKGVKGINSLDTIFWNMHKSYLFEFERQGIRIAETVLLKSGQDKRNLAEIMRSHRWTHSVLKPAVASSAFDLTQLSLDDPKTIESAEARIYKHGSLQKDYLLQKMIPSIVTKGEWNMIFIKGKNTFTSHKSIKYIGESLSNNDITLSVTPPQQVLETANKVLSVTPEGLVYARIDIIEDEDGGEPFLLEFEALEPWLHLADSDETCDALVAAILEYK